MAEVADLSRPSAPAVARRLIVLKHVAAYALAAPPRPLLAKAMQTWSADERTGFVRDAEGDRDDYWGEVCSLGLWDDLSPVERAFALSTAATMTIEQQADASWRVEAVHVLAWALGLVERLASYDAAADHALLAAIPCENVGAFIASAVLRPQRDIAAARDMAEFWHWRSRTRELVEEGAPFHAQPAAVAQGIRSYDDIVRVAARNAAADGLIPACIDEDFPAYGKAYRNLSDDEWAEVTSITMERHFALNWLCGLAPDNRWDETPTET